MNHKMYLSYFSQYREFNPTNKKKITDYTLSIFTVKFSDFHKEYIQLNSQI